MDYEPLAAVLVMYAIIGCILLLTIGAVVNTFVIGTRVMSRIWGVPVGPNAWESEAVALADHHP